MNLQKLFETQKALDEAIVKKKGLEGQDLLPQKILALQVELGECANEWRGFKFWSEDQEARQKVAIPKSFWHEGFVAIPVEPIKNQIYGYKNMFLEEYVDCLHFILSIGIEEKIDYEGSIKNLNNSKGWILEDRRDMEVSITDQFNLTFGSINDYSRNKCSDEYFNMMAEFIILGTVLGFKDKEVETAYYDKNQINHQRQENGY